MAGFRRFSADKREQPVSRRVALICLVAIALCSGILTWNVLAEATEKDWGWLVGGFFAALLVIWLTIEWLLATELHGNRHWTALLRPIQLARIGAVAIGSPLAVSQALPLFEPGPMTPGAFKAVMTETLDARAQLAETRVTKALPGLWGEVGCASAYRFEIVQPSGLRISWERRPENTATWTATATIVAVKEDWLETRGETPAIERGKAASFAYRSNGIDEQLTWTDQARDVSMELVRCEAR